MFLATALQTLGFGITGFEWRDHQHCYFHFDHSSGLEEAIKAYWDQSLRLEPQLMFTSFKSIKVRLHSSR
jgi:hypothetical protein